MVGVACSSKPSTRTGKATYLNVPTNNNNSDSGYFAYSNNRMPSPSPHPPSSSLGCWSRCWCHAASTASLELARTLSLGTEASRFAWQVTRNLFACQRTRLSPLIPPPKRLREIYLLAVYLELLLMLLLSICLAVGWPPKRTAREIVILPLSRISIVSV